MGLIVTVVSFKGGVGKTTTALHLAAYLQQIRPTLLVDGDPNRSASRLADRGDYGFAVCDERKAVRHARDFEFCVIDTKARPEPEDLASLASAADVLVIPSSPDALSLDVLLQTAEGLQALGAQHYRILLTLVPPLPNRDGEIAAASLRDAGYPVLDAQVGRRQVFQKAAMEAVPVQRVKDPSAETAWKQYCAVAKELFHGKLP